jgi:hypothetical protein
VGDLDEEFATFKVPQLGARAARRWYWRQTILSMAACLRAAAERSADPEQAPLLTVANTMWRRDGLGADLRSALRFLREESADVSRGDPYTRDWRRRQYRAVLCAERHFAERASDRERRQVGFDRGERRWLVHLPEYLATRATPGLRSVIAGGRTSTLMTDRNGKHRVVVQFVTANYFEALGVRPAARGRLLESNDDLPGRAPVAVVSHAFWRSRFASDPNVIGSSVKLHHAFFTIAGIAPDGFAGTQIGFAPDLWVPLTRGPLIENNPAMLGPTSAWLGIDGILEHRDSVSIVRDALAARWRAYRNP